MKRFALAIVVVLTVGLALPPGVAWASHTFHARVRSNDTGSGHGPHFIGHERNARPFPGHGPHFVGHGHPFVHHKLHVHPPFVRHEFLHPHFFGLIHPDFGSPVIVVDPTPKPVWMPGFWHWDGFQWVWVPGHWAFPGHRLVPRNPCD